MMQALDGDLGSVGQAALDDHLAHCDGCQLEWAQLRAVEEMLREAPMARPPAGFGGRVLVRIDRRRRFPRLAFGGFSMAAGAALVVLLAVAPALLSLFGGTSGSLTLYRALGLMLTNLVDAMHTVFRSYYLTLGALTIPALSFSLCGLTLALVSGLMWFYLVRRLQPVTVFARR
jgi:anti-sigma factor RsiW